MILSIKLQDTIFVSSNDTRLRWSQNYDMARQSIQNLFDIVDLGDEQFNRFLDAIFKVFKPDDAYNLYYLAEANLIIKNLIIDYENTTLNTQIVRFSEHPHINFLNYFGFEINKIPTKKQMAFLEDLKTQNIIEYYWLEGDMRKIESKPSKYSIPNNSSQIAVEVEIYKDEIDVKVVMDVSHSLGLTEEQDYVLDLGLNTNNEKRGAGATIIDFEFEATDSLTIIRKNQYLKTLSPNTQILGSVGRLSGINSDLSHQDNILTILFAKTPPNEPRKLFGVAPESNLIMCSVTPDSTTGELENFNNRRDKMNAILRSLLTELGGNSYQNAILLFEFEIDIITGPKSRLTGKYKKVYMPAIIIPDIANGLQKLSKNNAEIHQRGKNIISIVAAGNSGNRFDDIFKDKFSAKMSFFNFTYTDLKIPNSAFIMVGGAAKTGNIGKYEIDKKLNNGNVVEVYFYQSLVLSLQNTKFEGTSPAAAIVVGVIAYLQGKALKQFQKPITIDTIKSLLKKTCMQKFPDNVLTPTNLTDIWNQCQIELRNSQQQ